MCFVETVWIPFLIPVSETLLEVNPEANAQNTSWSCPKSVVGVTQELCISLHLGGDVWITPLAIPDKEILHVVVHEGKAEDPNWNHRQLDPHAAEESWGVITQRQAYNCIFDDILMIIYFSEWPVMRYFLHVLTLIHQVLSIVIEYLRFDTRKEAF